MRIKIVGMAILVAAVVLSACSRSIPVVTPQMDAQLMRSLQAGQAVLDCQTACSLSWASDLNRFARLDAQSDWHGLAIGVMQDGYASDLAYYYLGRAAEGLGADQAALRYYRVSGAIATGPNSALKCNGDLNLCNGVTLPDALYARIQTVEANLAARQAEAAHANKPKPRPVHKPALPAADEWIEPPPVTR